MEGTAGASSTLTTTVGSEQLPDCILVSSNRYHDILPFCNSLYYAAPQTWGRILPSDFPHNGSKEVEEEFLRRYFTETDIHMQGGANGTGAGFRFLKQVWLSIALWNYEQRVPSIASWWLGLEENSSVLEDPAMRETMCKDEVTTETFFAPRDIQEYGRNLLDCVIRHIQGRVKAKQDQPVEIAPVIEDVQSTDKHRSVSDSLVGKGESTPVASSSDVPNELQPGGPNSSYPPRATSATVAAGDFPTPFPVYQDKAFDRQHTLSGESGQSTWNAAHPTHQVHGRKRGGRLGSGGGSTRGGAGFDRRQQDYQHRLHSNGFSSNSGLEMSSPSPFSATSNHGSTMHPSHMPAAEYHPSLAVYSPAYDSSGAWNTRQHTRGAHFPSGELHPQPAMTPGMFAAGPTNTNNITYHQEMQRLPSERSDYSGYSGFNEISDRSGDVRRSSISSRGSGLRTYSQYRGRGGRGRDPARQTAPFFEEGPHARITSTEFHAKPNTNYNKRRGSAYQENTWRSGSEHPQIENTLPQRVLSGPEQYPHFQNFPGASDHHAIPPFPLRHSQAMGLQGQTEYRPSAGRLPRHVQPPQDFEVDYKYIGADATHVNELVVFDIPTEAGEDDVAKQLSLTCDVVVHEVRFVPYGQPRPTKMAFVKLPDHNVARRMLDLREVESYGQPLNVKVPKKMLTGQGLPFDPRQSRHDTSGMSFTPSREFRPDSYSFQQNRVPSSQFGLAAMAPNAYGYPIGHGSLGFDGMTPSTPFRGNKGAPTLSTVLSSNVTPTSSEVVTPKKGKSKKKNKNKPVTPSSKATDGGMNVQGDATSRPPSRETPVKTEHKKNEPLSESTSNDLSAQEENAAADNTPTSKEAKVSQQAGKMFRAAKDLADVDTSKLDAKAETSDEVPQSSQLKSAPIPVVSSSSQTPPDASNRADSASQGKRSRNRIADNKPHVAPVSSPVPNSDRPGIVGRMSDSDHVDESFHTASTSPPADSQPQREHVSMENAKAANSPHSHDVVSEGKRNAHPPQFEAFAVTPEGHVSHAGVGQMARHDSISSDITSVHTIKSPSPVETPKTPKTPLPISIQEPTPSTRDLGMASKDDKAPIPSASRSVSDPINTKKTLSMDEAAHDLDVTLCTPDTDTKREASGDVNSQKKLSAVAKQDMLAGDNHVSDLTVQHVVSATSIPPTPMTAYHTAPTTPALTSSSKPEHSTDKQSSQSKAPAKKGPSQTESFSMFGKKQQKQKKPAKGKGTIKGKPLDMGNTSSAATGTSSKDASGPTTPAPSSSSKKPALNPKTNSSVPAPTTSIPRTDNRSGETVSSESQGSPSKGGLRNLFGLFGRNKSPGVSGKETSLDDIPPGNELTPAIPQTEFNIDHLLQRSSDNPFDGRETSEDVGAVAHDSAGGRLVINNDTSGTSAPGVELPISSNFNFPKTPKKSRKKKKGKSAKQSEDCRGCCSDEEGDGGEDTSISASSAQTEAATASRGIEPDDQSDKSSTTMGRPTPPVSPTTLTPGTRRRIEQRRSQDHIVPPRAPRNRHIKKKSYSRIASSAGVIPAQETPAEEARSPSIEAAASEIELDQQRRIMHMYNISNLQNRDSGNDSDPQATTTRSRVLVLTDLTDDDENSQQNSLIYLRSLQISNDRILDVSRSTESSASGGDDLGISVRALETDDEATQPEDTDASPDLKE